MGGVTAAAHGRLNRIAHDLLGGGDIDGARREVLRCGIGTAAGGHRRAPSVTADIGGR
jgi:hypothetical protein